MRWVCLAVAAMLVSCPIIGASGERDQLPPKAVRYRQVLATFENEIRPLRVIFYVVPQKSVGVQVVSTKGELVRDFTSDGPNGLYQGTGVYDVTGDRWPEIVLVAWVGAKTLEATVFRFRSRELQVVFRWSGWSFRVIKLRGLPVLALTPLQYGSLTDLYVWREGKFVESNNSFPEFYGPEIDQQRRILNHPEGLPPYVISQACELGARALLYGKNYGDAEMLCKKALDVARSAPGLISATISAPPEALAAERKDAMEQIRKILEGIAEAKEQGKSPVPH